MASGSTLRLVQDAWDHLRLQRPLAAWASLQRALRETPGDPAATQALESLETSPELPAAARAAYRFQAPTDDARRARWDGVLKGQGLHDLEVAAVAFGRLADESPDGDARLNQALCLAWLGRNTEAIERLDQAVTLLATAEPERAAGAWTIAEVLRQGAGAEPLTDDLRFTWTIDSPDPLGLNISAWPNIRSAPVPDSPILGKKAVAEGEVFEWLDRPMPGPSDGVGRDAWSVPKVLATLIVLPSLVRISTPEPEGLARLDEPPFDLLTPALASARREAWPLPIAWADSGIGTFRPPAGLDPSALADLTRGVVERYFESIWLRHPRRALGGLSPVEAGRLASEGDAVVRARLAAVIRYREQLGTRATHVALYQGYPFDRLRRRVGLLIVEGEGTQAVAADDVSCMSLKELDALDPAALADGTLRDACLSAAGLGHDPTSARFVSAWLGRDTPRPSGGLEIVVAPLVRETLKAGEPGRALDALRRARELAADNGARRTLTLWTAEVLARTGRPADALAEYQWLVGATEPSARAAVALDAAETLLDNGHAAEARPLLVVVRDHASGERFEVLARRVDELLAGV